MSTLDLSSLHRKKAGFTLIEILVVLFIISIITSVALLSIRHNDNKRLETFANELAQLITLAEEQAMLTPGVLGLTFDEAKFQFSSRDEKNNLWIPFSDQVLGKHEIPSYIHIEVEVNTHANKEDENKNPKIVFSTNGDSNPFTIYIGQTGGPPRYSIVSQGDGNIVTRALS